MSSSQNLRRWAPGLLWGLLGASMVYLGAAWPANAEAAATHLAARMTANQTPNKKNPHHGSARTAGSKSAETQRAGRNTAGRRPAGRRPAEGRPAGRKPAGKKPAGSPHQVPATKSGLPNIQALGALVLDENGRELYARNPDRERPIASISKLAATLTVMDRGLELEGLTTITKADLEGTRGGARSRLLEGMTLSNRDLLHAALMGSDNRAIPALGRAVKLSPSQLAAAMTAKAKALGLKHTRFHDPTGLSIENVSTPRETIVLLRAVMNQPVLGPITQRIEYDAHPIGRPPITYVNTYRPAIRNNVQVLGGKTGYNDDARYCLVLAAKIDGHTCFMSFLSNEGKLTRFGDVARVADWIVSRKPKAEPPQKLAEGGPPPPKSRGRAAAATDGTRRGANPRPTDSPPTTDDPETAASPPTAQGVPTTETPPAVPALPSEPATEEAEPPVEQPRAP